VRQPASPRQLGFWMCLALVVGNMVGTGILLLPTALAPFGAISVLGWVCTTSGAVVLASVFARLGRALPEGGGPYGYTRAAFGDTTAFLVAWGYWMSLWIGNAAIATGGVSYLTPFFPSLANEPLLAAAATLALVWILTGTNALGVRSAGWVQSIITVAKIVPLLAVVLAGVVYLVRGGATAPGLVVPLSLDGVSATAALTLWSFLGLESATLPDGKVRDAAHTIPRATLWGTLLTAGIYIVASTTVLATVPAGTLAASTAPFSDLARLVWGEGGGRLLAFLAAISCFGTLNGWILVQGELPRTMARAGVFPAAFGRESRRGMPLFALVFTSALMTALILMNAHQGLVKVFTFMLLLATSTTLVMYVACALALVRLAHVGGLGAASVRGPLLVGVVGAVYGLWAFFGAGLEAGLWGLALCAAGLPVRWAVRRVQPSPA
jgi:APA family basic amino acid/polyamine antiporter